MSAIHQHIAIPMTRMSAVWQTWSKKGPLLPTSEKCCSVLTVTKSYALFQYNTPTVPFYASQLSSTSNDYETIPTKVYQHDTIERLRMRFMRSNDRTYVTDHNAV